MKKAQPKNLSWLRPRVLSINKIHFVLVASYIIQLVIFKSWNVITPVMAMRHWSMVAALLLVNIFVWYMTKNKAVRTLDYKKLIFLIIVADIAMACFYVYTQRGMASKAVALYAIPIIISAVLASKSALFATTILCIIAYATTAISYFVLNFNEGYRVELYGEIIFYSGLFLVLGLMLWVLVRPNHTK